MSKYEEQLEVQNERLREKLAGSERLNEELKNYYKPTIRLQVHCGVHNPGENYLPEYDYICFVEKWENVDVSNICRCHVPMFVHLPLSQDLSNLIWNLIGTKDDGKKCFQYKDTILREKNVSCDVIVTWKILE